MSQHVLIINRIADDGSMSSRSWPISDQDAADLAAVYGPPHHHIEVSAEQRLAATAALPDIMGGDPADTCGHHAPTMLSRENGPG